MDKHINLLFGERIGFINTITTDLGKTHTITKQPSCPKIILSPWI